MLDFFRSTLSHQQHPDNERDMHNHKHTGNTQKAFPMVKKNSAAVVPNVQPATTTTTTKPIRHRRGYRSLAMDLAKASALWENMNLFSEKFSLYEEEEALQNLARAATSAAHYIHQRIGINKDEPKVPVAKPKKEIDKKNEEPVALKDAPQKKTEVTAEEYSEAAHDDDDPSMVEIVDESKELEHASPRSTGRGVKVKK